jgi:hypothetical protein
MIFNIFSPKNLTFLTQNGASLCKKAITTQVFKKKNAIFSPKIGKNR